MKYATVMVGLALGRSNEARPEVAAQLAERFRASVIGVAATEVTVVEVAEDEADRAAAVSRVGDVVAWLSRHGVRASEQVPEQCSDTAAQLESIASNVGAGVVIAGAYGRSRLSEWILGGVTR